MAAVALLYGANQFFLKEISDSILVHWYLNDVLAGLGLVGVASLLLKWSPFRKQALCIAWGSALPLAAGLYWEYVAPLYRGGTADPFDLLAYLAGGMVGWFALRCSTVSKQFPPTPSKSWNRWWNKNSIDAVSF